MSFIENVRVERLEKIKKLKEAGISPYALSSSKTHTVDSFLKLFEKSSFAGLFKKLSKKEVTLNGRVMSLRGQGAITFFDIDDGTGRVQVYFKKDESNPKLSYEFFKEVVDRGDFVEVTGVAYVTKRGQQSLFLKEWTMLTKSLLPLPEEWFGIKDDDERYRKRHLDLLLRENARNLFVQKAAFWDAVRTFMKKRFFLEVETPTLELTTGGAEATPFKTHHNDFDLDVFLRISVGELWQKKLMAAGFPRTFEIGRVYRNEGSSSEHLQEFTNMEFYAAYMNFEEGKELVKQLYKNLAKEVFGKTSFTYKDYTFDFTDEWEELDYVKTIEEKTGVNVLEADEEELKAKLKELKVSHEGANRERLTDSLWKYCRRQVHGPAFLVNHPKLVAPLSKENPDDSRLTKTFQVILAGSEVGRAHAELNDPVDQRARFEKQKELLDAGDDEAMMPDWEYVETMEQGMPPMFGFGFGERFFAILSGTSIRETQLFPLMKPREK